MNENEIKIKLTKNQAQSLFEILCELPFRPATCYDTEPPIEREYPVQIVIEQITKQMGWDDENE
jgi:hypothetical protein